MFKHIMCISIFVLLQGCATNSQQVSSFQPVTIVDIQQIQVPIDCHTDSKLAIAIAGECDGLVGIYLSKQDSGWSIFVQRISNIPADSILVRRAFCDTIMGLKTVSQELGDSILKSAQLLDTIVVKEKSTRENLVFLPTSYLFVSKEQNNLLLRKRWILLDKKHSNPSLEFIVKRIPTLIRDYYGECKNDLPGCLVQDEIQSSLMHGGSGRLGCMK